MRIRAASVEDVAAILAIERECPSAAHWTRQQYEDLFRVSDDQPESFERLAWVVEKPVGARGQVPNQAPQIVAFLVARRVAAEWELENIAVAERARQQGHGTQLVREFMSHVRVKAGTGIFLEVRESNLAARMLYRKLGFDEAGLRIHYYTDPVENAVVYRFDSVALGR